MTSTRAFLLLYIILETLHSGFFTTTKEKLTFYTNAKSWNDAKTICEQSGSSLVTISSPTKQYFIEKYLQNEWVQSVPGNVWTGLHEIDSSDGSKVKWIDCNNVTYHKYVTTPSSVADDNKCFSINPSTGQWKTERCDVKLSFICEVNLGLCDFDRYYPRTGCSGSLKQTGEYSLYDCLNACRNIPIQSEGEECWGVGFYQGYTEDDCWMFLSVDPEACSKSSFSNNNIDMYLKTCFTNEVNNTILADNSVALIPDTSCMVNIPLISSTQGDFTMQSTNSVSITMTTTNNPDVCTCPCRANSTKSIEQQLMDIKKELTINKKKTSAYLRTLSCADDYRSSSKVIGYAGIIFIVLEISLFVFLDSPNLMKLFKFIYKKR